MEQALIFLFILLLGFIFADLPLIISYFLRPKIKDEQENIPYESGELPKLEARKLTFGYFNYMVIYLVGEIFAVFLFISYRILFNNIYMFFLLISIFLVNIFYFLKQKYDNSW